MNKLFTVRELADLFSLDIQTVYRLVKANKIPVYRVGKSLRFDPLEILMRR